MEMELKNEDVDDQEDVDLEGITLDSLVDQESKSRRRGRGRGGRRRGRGRGRGRGRRSSGRGVGKGVRRGDGGRWSRGGQRQRNNVGGRSRTYSDRGSSYRDQNSNWRNDRYQDQGEQIDSSSGSRKNRGEDFTTSTGIQISTSGSSPEKQTSVRLSALPKHVLLTDLEEILAKYGSVRFCYLVKNDQGKATGKAMVCYTTTEEAQKCVESLEDVSIDGTPIQVSFMGEQEENRSRGRRQEFRTQSGRSKRTVESSARRGGREVREKDGNPPIDPQNFLRR